MIDCILCRWGESSKGWVHRSGKNCPVVWFVLVAQLSVLCLQKNEGLWSRDMIWPSDKFSQVLRLMSRDSRVDQHK